MLKGQLTLTSINKSKLKKFVKFFNKFTKKGNFNLSQRYPLWSSTKLKKFTVLKSPHVHKTAQEHFGIALFKVKLQFMSCLQFDKVFLFLKCISVILFELNFSLTVKFFNIDTRTTEHFFLSNFFVSASFVFRFNPNRFLIIKKERLTSYILLFDMFGELNLLSFKNKKFV